MGVERGKGGGLWERQERVGWSHLKAVVENQAK